MRKSTTGLTPGWGEPCSPGQAEACPTTRTFLSPARASRSAVPVRPYRPARTSPAAAGSLLEGLTLKPSAKAYQVFYNEAVQSHWRETTVGEHGELVLEGLPFEPGQPVEVLVVSKAAASAAAVGGSLRDSVLEFREPLEPVASEDWDALK